MVTLDISARPVNDPVAAGLSTRISFVLPIAATVSQLIDWPAPTLAALTPYKFPVDLVAVIVHVEPSRVRIPLPVVTPEMLEFASVRVAYGPSTSTPAVAPAAPLTTNTVTLALTAFVPVIARPSTCSACANVPTLLTSIIRMEQVDVAARTTICCSKPEMTTRVM
jgi:hypothetical protein